MAKALASKQSGLPKGVQYTKNGEKFMVRVYRSGSVKCLGVYDTVEEATQVYEQFNIDYPRAPLGPKPKGKINASLLGTPWYGL